jgi:hypothetical protein
MRSSTLRKAALYILIFNFIAATFPPQALAAIIATPVAITAHENNNAVSRLKELLAREDVRGQLVQLGVDPAIAEQRVDALTPSEIAQLQPQLDSLPAGGVDNPGTCRGHPYLQQVLTSVIAAAA